MQYKKAFTKIHFITTNCLFILQQQCFIFTIFIRLEFYKRFNYMLQRVFAAPALGIFHLMAAATEGNNFKTLAQELGQFEYSYLGEKFVKIPRGNNFPPIMQGLFLITTIQP